MPLCLAKDMYLPAAHSRHAEPAEGLCRPGAQPVHLSEPQSVALAHTPVEVPLMDVPEGHFVHAPFSQ